VVEPIASFATKSISQSMTSSGAPKGSSTSKSFSQ